MSFSSVGKPDNLDDLSEGPLAELLISPRQAGALFPFHIVVNRDMIMVQLGPSMAKLMPALKAGENLTKCWSLESPAIDFSYEAILAKLSTLFVMIADNGRVRLRGQMLPIARGEQIVFLCSPWLPEPGEFTLSGLTFQDFPLHDSMPEFMNVLQMQRLGMQDLRKLSVRLREQREALADLNRRLVRQEAESRKLALVAACTENGVLITDSLGRVEWVNEAYAKCTGFTLAELRGKTPGSVLHGPETDPATVAYMRGKIREGQSFQCEVLNYQKGGGQYWVALEGQPIRDKAGQVTNFTGVIRDITVKKQDDIVLRRAMQQIEEANQAKSDFLAGIGHEIRTPLNSITGLSELLLETPLEGDQKEMASTIWACSESLLNLVNDLLDFSSIEAGRVEISSKEFDLAAVCERAVNIMSSRARQKRLALVCTVEPRPAPHLLGDETRISQILVNLIANGIKFTATGSVCVDVRWSTQQPGTAAIDIFVRDTGIGISPGSEKHIFEKFYRIDTPTGRRVGGTGLGLSISRRLAEQMHGTLDVEVGRQPGSCFRLSLTLPVVSGGEALPGPGRPVSILLLSQHPNIELLSKVWTSADLDVVAVDNLTAGRAHMEGTHRYDIVVLDGSAAFDSVEIEALCAQRAQCKAVKWIQILPPEGTDSLSGLLNGTVVKVSFPLTPSRIHAAVREVLTREGEVSPLTAAVNNEAEGAVGPSQVRILLVEDNPDSQAYVARVFKKAGHDLEFAASIAETVNLVASRKFDIVFMDVMLPDGDGFEATRKIRELERSAGLDRVPVVALTAGSTHESRKLATDSGMDDYMTKPVRPDALLEAVERWRLHGGTPAHLKEHAKLAVVEVEPDLTDLIPGYLGRVQQQLARLSELAATGDHAAIRKIGHNLKGAGAAFGFAEISSSGKIIEEAGRSESPAAAVAAGSKLTEYLQHVRWQPGVVLPTLP